MFRPNLLILYTDQQHLDALRGKGNSGIQTPNPTVSPPKAPIRNANQGINTACIRL